MPSPIAKERSDFPSPKRKKVGETTYDDSSDPSDSDEDSTDEDLQLFNQEMRKSGVKDFDFLYSIIVIRWSLFSRNWYILQGYEIDLSKLRYTFGWKRLDLDQISLIDGQEESNRDFIAMLLKHAFTKHANETVRISSILKKKLYIFLSWIYI